MYLKIFHGRLLSDVRLEIGLGFNYLNYKIYGVIFAQVLFWFSYARPGPSLQDPERLC